MDDLRDSVDLTELVLWAEEENAVPDRLLGQVATADTIRAELSGLPLAETYRACLEIADKLPLAGAKARHETTAEAFRLSPYARAVLLKIGGGS